MPTYEYACKSCGEHLEVAQSFKDDALTQCPACGGPLRKVFGNIGITFKGSGFYRTDSRSDGRKGAQKSGEGKAGEGKASEVKSGEASSGGSTKSDTSSSSSGSSSSSESSGPSSSSGSSSGSKSEGSSKSGSGSVKAAS
jgi:putative FmdB family regulatory protein